MEQKPSCAYCPSFLKKGDAQKKFGKNIGSAVCGRYGTVLDSPKFTETNQTKKLQEHIASSCPSYGQPLPYRPEFKFEVSFPDLDELNKGLDEDKKLISNCAACKFFIPDETVAQELGWMAGLCTAKGKLILPSRRVAEAKECEYRQFGTPRSSTDGVVLLPEYGESYAVVDPIKSYFEAQESIIDPSVYETDKEVTEEDAALGIRAWRKVDDGTGERFTYLPIYDKTRFTPAEQALVPSAGDDEHPELYVDHFGGVYLAAVTWGELDETPALWGEPGTGKTELFRHLAYLMQLPFRRISITASTELDDIAGKMHYTPERGTYFQYGRLPIAWTRPGVICIDEPNVGPPDVWQFLRPLTDNSKQLVLDQNEGEVISRHQDCYMGMAMNQSWDAKNVGTMQIGEADANRLFHVLVPRPPEKLEIEIIKQRIRLDGWEMDDASIKMIMGIAEDLRNLIEEGTLQISWAIRPQIKVARALHWFDPLTAYRRAIADYLEPEASQALLDVVRAHAS